ncbi:type II secretion system protein GspL [Desulfatitalea alkaliphila]|uniref:Type II secretion system protein GspL n=1 Tax=Desulfatitalea alkaliphila TaxID=2929485 RepID=A0AA41UKL9_9BACT|nr:type II secretion system protein GspL [Desulfatitalea alkaliphila]MCJ8500581.1 type II secretion system protein GspL [Desulfatitalea alkaliphila]
MSRQIIAIDIRATSIVGVLLTTGLKTNVIEGCAEIPLVTSEANQDPLLNALTELRRQLAFDHAGAVIGLPADHALFRTISVPFNEDKKIRQILPFELEPTLPVPVDDLVIDYQKAWEGESTGLLTIAIERRELENIMATMTEARIAPQLVVPGDFASALCLTHHDQGLPEHALLLNVGLTKTTLFTLVNGKIALARCLASDVGTEAGVEMLTLKIRQTLTAFADRQPNGFAPTTVYLNGPALDDEAAAARLIQAMEIPSQTVDLRTMVHKLDMAETTQWRPCVMNGALALALVEAEGRNCPNFHRTRSVFKNYWTTYRPYVRGPAIVLGIVLLLGMGGVLLENHLLQKRLDHIHHRMEEIFAATFPGSRRVGDALNQMKSEIRGAQGGNIDAGQAIPQVRTVDILQQLSTSIPKELDVLFNRLVLGSDDLTVAGETTGFNVVDEVKNHLEQKGLFKQVTIASANMDRSGNKVRFSLKLEL